MGKAKGRIKTKWKGVFSYRCELERLYCHAYTKAQARAIMCRRLAKMHDVHVGTVLSMFDGNKPNFNIEIEIEYREVLKNDMATN